MINLLNEKGGNDIKREKTPSRSIKTLPLTFLYKMIENDTFFSA